jgi:hypothetical protein
MMLALAPVMLWGAGPDYLPLHVGNQWILENPTEPSEILNIEVLRSRSVNNRSYYLVTGYASEDVWLRNGDDGVLYALSPANNRDERFANMKLGAPAYRAPISGCAGVTGHPSAAGIPIPGMETPLRIVYTGGSCRDSGITQETYRIGIGLTERIIATIRGPRAYRLAWAKVNGEPVLNGDDRVIMRSDFSNGAKGWLAGFSDYSLEIDDLRMAAELRGLPDELERGTAKGYFVESMNRSDDIFMFLKRQVTTRDGLKPNTSYRLTLDIEFASNAPTGCVGVGGAPGEGVYLKAGASGDEPVANLQGFRDVTLNIDKGQQSVGGLDAGVVGDIANGKPCDNGVQPYVRLRKQYTHERLVHTDNRGVLWLLVGTDSAYEGLTGLYYQAITARLTPTVGE